MKPKVVTAWHEAVAKSDLTAFEALVNDDAVFESPALHKPQVGKAMVSMYLRGAACAELVSPLARRDCGI